MPTAAGSVESSRHIVQDMFSAMKHDLKLVRLFEDDAKSCTDHLRALSDLIVANEEVYPGINKWLRNKVIPGLKSGERVAFVGYLHEEPAISAVVKRGGNAKFCHLKINTEIQDIHLGELFLALMALEVKRFAREVHFTLPESLWVQEMDFFRSFGFEEATKAFVQYRKGEVELRCSAPFSRVWKAATGKLSKIYEAYSIDGFCLTEGLLMSIEPVFADRILRGEKKVEIRRRFSRKWIGRTVRLYSSAPMQSLVGDAKIGNVVSGTPEEIWNTYAPFIGCTKIEYDNYTTSLRQVYAILLSEVRPYIEAIPLSQLSHLIDADLVPPQSYCAIEKSKSWTEALSLATLLQNSFRYIRPAVFSI